MILRKNLTIDVGASRGFSRALRHFHAQLLMRRRHDSFDPHILNGLQIDSLQQPLLISVQGDNSGR